MARPMPLEPPVISAARDSSPWAGRLCEGRVKAPSGLAAARTRSIRLAAVSRRRVTFAVALALRPRWPPAAVATTATRGPTKPPPEARPEDFPKAHGKTLPSSAQPCRRRARSSRPRCRSSSRERTASGFGLFDRSRAQIADAQAAVYVAPAGGGKARGPFPARYESLRSSRSSRARRRRTTPTPRSRSTSPTFASPSPASYERAGVARLDNRLVAATLGASRADRVAPRARCPRWATKAPVIHTPTEADAAGDIASIDTRVPPSTMHEGTSRTWSARSRWCCCSPRRALCQSRVCGPVVDIAEQVKAERGDEVRRSSTGDLQRQRDPDGFRPQVAAWHLPTEPWVFAIDKRARSPPASRGPTAPASCRRRSRRL